MSECQETTQLPTLLRDPSASDPTPPESTSPYFQTLSELRFDTASFVHHKLKQEIGSTSEMQNSTNRYNRELRVLSNHLPCESHGAIFVRMDSERMDLLKALISGTEDTPYANGLYLFDIACPGDYPVSPPKVSIITTGHKRVRFNPNLYDDGFVCLSIINTWEGSESERWNASHSNILQVLMSIQVLVMDKSVIQKEPDYENLPNDSLENMLYSNIVKYNNVKFAMVEMLRNPPEEFKEVVLRHFALKKQEILEMVDKWVTEAAQEENKINYNKVDCLIEEHNTFTLQMFKCKPFHKRLAELKYSLVEEFRKLPDLLETPPGLLDLPPLTVNPDFKLSFMSEGGGFKHSLSHVIGTLAEYSVIEARLKGELEQVKLLNCFPHRIIISAEKRRHDLLKIAVSGNPQTDLAFGFFVFEVALPPEYPASPPRVILKTTGKNNVAFSKNLTNRGKVVAPRLKEAWDSSCNLETVVSALMEILSQDPLEGLDPASLEYTTTQAVLRYSTIKYAISEMYKSPPAEMKMEIQDCFRSIVDSLNDKISGWVKDSENVNSFEFDCALSNVFTVNEFFAEGYNTLMKECFSYIKNISDYYPEDSCSEYSDEDKGDSVYSVGSEEEKISQATTPAETVKLNQKAKKPVVSKVVEWKSKKIEGCDDACSVSSGSDED